MSDHDRSADFSVHRTYLRSLVASASVFGVLIYVASEYFEIAQFSQLLSFRGADGPGPLPKNLYPEPLGVHFFGDFLIPFRLAQQPSPYLAVGILSFSYFPMSSVLLAPLILLDYWPALAAFLIVSLGTLMMATARLGTFLEGRIPIGVLVSMVLFSGPMLSMLDRGNLSLSLTALSVFAVVELRRCRSTSSAILFGLAAAMKAYPLIFLVVFVRRRDWRSLGAGIGSFAIATAIPLAMYEGGMTRNLRAMVNQFIASGTTVHASNVRAYNNSFFALFDSMGMAGEWFRNNYTFLFGIVAICFMLCAIAKSATDFEALLISTVVMVFSPQTVGQYVLLLFLVPILWLVSDDKTVKWEAQVVVILLGILMVPKGLPLAGPQAEWSPAVRTFTSTVNPLIGILLLLICAIAILRRGRMIARIQRGVIAPTDTRLDS